MKRNIAIVLLLVMIFTVFAGCGGGATPPAAPAPGGGDTAAQPADGSTDINDLPVARIAVFAPMTGEHAEFGLNYRAAAELQAELWNARGGAGGFRIEVVYFDDRNMGEEAAAIAERMILDPLIMGSIGSFTSGTVMAATPILQEYGMVNISPSASHPDYTAEGNYIFRNNTMIAIEGSALVDLLIEHHDSSRIGILYIRTDWGLITGEIMYDLVNARDNLEVVIVEATLDGADDFSVAIANFEAANVDTIIVAGMHNTFVPFARQYRAVNPDIKFGAFANLYNPQVLELGGDAVDGVVFPVTYSNESTDPGAVEFREGFLAATGRLPCALTSHAFDSAGILIQAIANVGMDRSAIRDYLDIIEFHGVGGLTTFDEFGDAYKSFLGVIARDGAFRLL